MTTDDNDEEESSLTSCHGPRDVGDETEDSGGGSG
jgi:hypothetical protein